MTESEAYTNEERLALDEIYAESFIRLLTPLCRPAPHTHPDARTEEDVECATPGKRPLTFRWNPKALSRWQGAERITDHQWVLEQHLTAGGNVGLVVPPGAVVLDADTPEAVAWCAAAMPDAPMQETNRGAHFVVRVPLDTVISAGVRVALTDDVNVDVRSAGRSQIVVEPSIHESGALYCWKQPLPERIEDLPSCPPLILDAITAKSTAGETAKSAGLETLTIHKGERNDTLYRIGCAMRAKGDSEAEIGARLRVRNAERCSPPLPESEVDAIAASAAKHEAGEEPHDVRPEEDVQPLRLLTAEEIFADKIPDAVIDGMVHRGQLSTLPATNKGGKTYFALQAAMAVAAGVQFLGKATRR